VNRFREKKDNFAIFALQDGRRSEIQKQSWPRAKMR
jgi:hypothetical protein